MLVTRAAAIEKVKKRLGMYLLILFYRIIDDIINS